MPQGYFKWTSVQSAFKFPNDASAFQMPKRLNITNVLKNLMTDKKKWNICVSHLLWSKAYICYLKIKITLNTAYGKESDEDETAESCFKNIIHDSF